MELKIMKSNDIYIIGDGADATRRHQIREVAFVDERLIAQCVESGTFWEVIVTDSEVKARFAVCVLIQPAIMADVNASVSQKLLVSLFVVDVDALIFAVDVELYPVSMPSVVAIALGDRSHVM